MGEGLAKLPESGELRSGHVDPRRRRAGRSVFAAGSAAGFRVRNGLVTPRVRLPWADMTVLLGHGERAHRGDREVRAALSESRRLFLSVGLFSILVNLLMLTGPVFMLRVYDRVRRHA